MLTLSHQSHLRFLSVTGIVALLMISGCMRSQPEVIVITATFLPPTSVSAVANNPTPPSLPPISLSPVPNEPQSFPTPNPTRSDVRSNEPTEYIVQSGDTLSRIAATFNMSMDTILSANNLANPDLLSVGQVLVIPGAPEQETSTFKILPDSLVVRGPGSRLFDVAGFIAQQPGYIRFATDEVPISAANGLSIEQTMTAAQIVTMVAEDYSVDPRLLLTILEYRGGWLSNSAPDETERVYPITGATAIHADRRGLYRQLIWAANEINRAYYGWKYRGQNTLELEGGIRFRYGPGLNAGTVALQYFLSLNTPFAVWQNDISPQGFYRFYYAYWGDPFSGTRIDPLVPPNLVQPTLTFPFSPDETWFFTGGPHGGWGSGSAWSAFDLAPPDDLPDGSPFCYTSAYWVTAMAPGIIARGGRGAVVLDLDNDGDESTGWSILYLHIATEGRVAVGTTVNSGDPIGRPSCEGGFSTATHVHIARRFNGEWIPAFCHECLENDPRPPFVMNGWTLIGLQNQEYQGYLERDTDTRIAEQGRLNPLNQLSW